MISENNKYLAKHHSKYYNNTKCANLKFNINVQEPPQRIKNSNKNHFLEKLKIFINNTRNCKILLFFLFFSKIYCPKNTVKNDLKKESEIIPHNFLDYDKYQNFKNKIIKINYSEINQFFLSNDKNEILGCILFENKETKSDYFENKPVIYKIIKLFINEIDQKKLVDIMQEKNKKDIMKLLGIIFLSDDITIFNPEVRKFIKILLKLMQNYNYKNFSLVEKLIKKFKKQQIVSFLFENELENILYVTLCTIYKDNFKCEQLRNSFINVILENFMEFSHSSKGCIIIQGILEYEKNNIKMIKKIFSKILNSNNFCFIDFCLDKSASFFIQKLLSTIYNENTSEKYKGIINNINLSIFKNFIELSYSVSGSYITQQFLEYEMKNINNVDSYILKILNDLFYFDEFFDFCNHVTATYVARQLLTILYDANMNEKIENTINKINKNIYNNLRKLYFSDNGTYIIFKFLEHEKNNINNSDSYILKILNDLIYFDELTYFCKEKKGTYLVRKLLSILYGANTNERIEYIINKINNFIINNLGNLCDTQYGTIIIYKFYNYAQKNLYQYKSFI